ncbi:MAG: hypothetical protein LQ348_006038 [Seirophora lacunosa]|nr:MAG: hypothetical protein LQ348_006038 [Seirophora lacunosa]
MYEHLLLLAFPSQNSGNDQEIRREDHGTGPASRFSATLYATNYSAASQTRVSAQGALPITGSYSDMEMVQHQRPSALAMHTTAMYSLYYLLKHDLVLTVRYTKPMMLDVA